MGRKCISQLLVESLLIVISILCAASGSVTPQDQKDICTSLHTWSTSRCCSPSPALSGCDLGEAADLGETADLGEATGGGEATDLGEPILGGVTAGWSFESVILGINGVFTSVVG